MTDDERHVIPLEIGTSMFKECASPLMISGEDGLISPEKVA